MYNQFSQALLHWMMKFLSQKIKKSNKYLISTFNKILHFCVLNFVLFLERGCMWREIAVQSTWTTEFSQLDTNRRSIKHPVFKEYGHPSYRFGCIFPSKKNYVWSTFGSVYLKADKKEKYFVFIHGDRNLDLVSFHIRLVPLPFEPFRHL